MTEVDPDFITTSMEHIQSLLDENQKLKEELEGFKYFASRPTALPPEPGPNPTVSTSGSSGTQIVVDGKRAVVNSDRINEERFKNDYPFIESCIRAGLVKRFSVRDDGFSVEFHDNQYDFEGRSTADIEGRLTAQYGDVIAKQAEIVRIIRNVCAYKRDKFVEVFSEDAANKITEVFGAECWL